MAGVNASASLLHVPESLPRLWNDVLFGGDEEHKAWVIGMYPFVQHQVLFWSYGMLLWYLCDSRVGSDTARVSFAGRHKLQRLLVSKAEMHKCAWRVFWNQMLVLLPVSLLEVYATLNVPALYTPERYRWEHIPVWWKFAAYIGAFTLLEELLFYYSHRLLHWGPFYAHIHKIHHEFKAPMGMAAEYAHIIEMIFSNVLPVALGPALLQAHVAVSWTWYALAVFVTICHHSGYKFPWMVGSLDPRFHDYHHFSFKWNFGLLGWLDRLHQTDKGYADYCEKLLTKKL